MSFQQRQTGRSRTQAGRVRRAGGDAARRPNRSELRAAESRAAATVAAPPATPSDVAEADLGGPVAGRASAARRLGRPRAVARPIVLSREQEYAFIRADLRRLLITAAGLFLLMIVLLFLID